MSISRLSFGKWNILTGFSTSDSDDQVDLNQFSFPKPFKCSLKPRSPEAEKLIRSGANLELF